MEIIVIVRVIVVTEIMGDMEIAAMVVAMEIVVTEVAKVVAEIAIVTSPSRAAIKAINHTKLLA